MKEYNAAKPRGLWRRCPEVGSQPKHDISMKYHHAQSEWLGQADGQVASTGMIDKGLVEISYLVHQHNAMNRDEQMVWSLLK